VDLVDFVSYMPTTTAALNTPDLQRWRACAKRFWLHRQHDLPDAPCSTVAEADSGDVLIQNAWPDQALKATFPLAKVIEVPTTPAQWDAAIAQTHAHLANGQLLGDQADGKAVFGACLASNDGVQVRMDVLANGQHGLRVFKVRHATVGNDSDIDAIALWAHVAARCGLRVQSAGLLLVDTDFIYPGHGCYAGLFREVDLSPVLGSRPVASWLVGMRACENQAEPPALPDAPCTQHGGCAFMSHCGVAPPETKGATPISLDIVGRELAAELREEGHADLLTVHESQLPDERRRRALRAVQQGQPELDPAVAATMQALGYPRATLRFDTIGFATPIWPGTRPYQVLPFQWTCDVEPTPGQLVRHSYLAGQEGDPRRAFAESLLAAVGQTGPVMAYNAGFERNRIRELATLFEDLATDLEILQHRIVDLFQIARGHYYHPVMCGSWSFKSICKAVAPDLHVERFEWGSETAPQVAFAKSQQGGLDAPTLQGLRNALIAHGQRETEALRRMVTLFERAAMAPAVKQPS
jgi:hypothetical protein